MAQLRRCKACLHNVHKPVGGRCPNCGALLKTPAWKVVGFVVLLLPTAFVVAAFLGAAASAFLAHEKPSRQEQRQPEQEINGGPLHSGESNARRSAELYISQMPFSRSGLVNQLVNGEGFSRADAEYGVSSITIDWRAQAAKSAALYLSQMPFSRSGLVDQLVIGEGFTRTEAEYGVSTTGL